jgi:UDP-glucose 4-epimerase
VENLALGRDRLEFVQGDIRDRELVVRTARSAEVIFHHAALASVPRTVEDPLASAEINDLGTLNVFLAAREAGTARVVYASSSAIYGTLAPPPHIEGLLPDPNSPYAAHKLIGEHYARMFQNLFGVDIISLRYFNVFGPRQDPSSPYSGVISIFMDRLQKGQPPVIYGDGGQSRDYIYVKDVVRANFLAALGAGSAGRVYNIGTGQSHTLHRLLEILQDLSGQSSNPTYRPARAGDVYESRADTSRAKTELAFTAETSFQDGLAATWAWATKPKP